MDFRFLFFAQTGSESPKQKCAVLEENLKKLKAQYRYRRICREVLATVPLRLRYSCCRVKLAGAREAGGLSSFRFSIYFRDFLPQPNESLCSYLFRFDPDLCVRVKSLLFNERPSFLCHQTRFNCCWLFSTNEWSFRCAGAAEKCGG